MKIDIKSTLDGNAIDIVLKERGVSRAWLEAGREDLLDGRVLRNFDKAQALLNKHLKDKIGIFVDSDTDGFSSSGIIYQWLKKKYDIQPVVIIPEGKIHGILPHLIPDDLDLLIVPDASSSEALIHKELIAKGIDVLVLDHHEFNLSNGESATIVNPQHPDCPYANKNISGTGVTYKFMEGVDKNEGVDFHSEYIDLVAIATVADVMDLKTMDNKALVNIGLSHIVNPYFSAYHKFDQRIKDMEVDPIVVGFYMVPPINALIRLGGVAEKTELFEAIVGELPAEMVVATVGKIKGRQDRQKDPIITRVAMTLNAEEGSKEHAIIMTTAPFNTPRSMTGLIAGQMTNIYSRPIFLGQIGNGTLVGSARNLNNSNIENLKDFCIESGLFNWAAGHQSAFGYSIPEENIKKFLTYCDENLPKYEPVFHADFALAKGMDKSQIVFDVSELKPHYGPGFPEVVIYDSIIVKPSNIALKGPKNDVLIITTEDMEYIAFKFKGDLPISVAEWQIVGKPSINEFMGNKKAQIKMEGWIIKPIDL